MKRLSVLPLAVACAATIAIGQDAKAPANTASLALVPALAATCPVGLTVKHADSFVEKQTGYTPGPQQGIIRGKNVQRIHLTMSNPSSRKIVGVQLTVYGFSSKERNFTLASASPDVSRKVDLALELDANGQYSGDLSLDRLTALSTVDLDSVTYADGSTWQAAKSGECRVVPDMLMLVSTNR
jgi:hypothetical protein